MDARLDTGGWRALPRQGLSPCKRRQAYLGAVTPGMSCALLRVGSMPWLGAALRITGVGEYGPFQD
jgi:hypothetical protein